MVDVTDDVLISLVDVGVVAVVVEPKRCFCDDGGVSVVDNYKEQKVMQGWVYM